MSVNGASVAPIAKNSATEVLVALSPPLANDDVEPERIKTAQMKVVIIDFVELTFVRDVMPKLISIKSIC